MEDNNKTAEEQKIIIDLAESMNSRSFVETKIIHKVEFKKAIRLINDKIEKAKHIKDRNYDERNRFNDTITIFGSRGSGKTSFLMSVLKNYEKNDDVEVIELIDPTLIEEKGHIFLTLISLIQDKVENVISKKECNPCCRDYQQRKCWENKLKKLASGLPSIDIDSGSPYSNWDDPEHVMKKGLNAVKAAKKLEENFDEIVKVALEILGKQAFLIAFDDIDVNFNNGWKVLETLRKYLTSPRIITLLSGDIKLFSKSIRKQQWDIIGDKLLTYEGEKLERIEKFDEIVTEIEGQYMQKIMKAPYRIHLLTIGEKINDDEIQIKINGKDKLGKDREDNVKIYEYYTDRLNALGLQNKYEVHAVITYLLGLPLRTQIQLLKQFEDIKNNGDKSLEILNITDSFISDMYESGVDVEQAKSQPKDFCYIAHEFLLKKELLNETYQLLPTSGSANYNAVLFSLFTMFVAHSKSNPSMFFEYWITIATIKNLLTIMPYRSDLKKSSTLIPTIEGLSEYSFIGQNKVYRDICSYMSTYIRATLNNNKGGEIKTPWGGILVLKGLVNRPSIEAQDKIDRIFSVKTSISRQVVSFPMSIASFAHKQQSIILYSFYTLLGTIVELLKRYNVIIKDRNCSEKEIIDEIHILLKELSQIKDNVMPAFEKATDSTDQETIYDNIEDEIDDDDKILAKVLCKWMKKNPKCVPPHLIGKIATRAFYAMRNLDDKESSYDNVDLGDAVHKRIVIVMNSVLVEDAKENLKTFNLSNNNPAEKETIFISNLDKIACLQQTCTEEEINNQMEFSRWLLACPLFLLYLNPNNNEMQNEIRQAELKPDIKESSKNNKGTTILNKISWCLDIYNGCFIVGANETENEAIVNWFNKNSVYNELKNVNVSGKNVRKSSKNKKKKLLLAKDKIKETVMEIKHIYKTPIELLQIGSLNINEKLKIIFDNSGKIDNQIKELIELCEGCSTWDEVIEKKQKVKIFIGNK